MPNVTGIKARRTLRLDYEQPYSNEQQPNNSLKRANTAPPPHSKKQQPDSLIRANTAPPTFTYKASPKEIPNKLIDALNNFETITNEQNILKIESTSTSAEETKEFYPMEQESSMLETPQMTQEQMASINEDIDKLTQQSDTNVDDANIFSQVEEKIAEDATKEQIGEMSVDMSEEKIAEDATKEQELIRRNPAFFTELFNNLQKGFNAFISKFNLHKFTEPPTDTSIAVVFITKHGGYEVFNDSVKKRLTIESFPCPVKNLIRLQLAPHGTCSWATPSTNFRDFSNIYCNLLKTNIPQFHRVEAEQQPLNAVNDQMIQTIIHSLNESAKFITSTELCTTDYHAIQGNSPAVGEHKICEKLKYAGKTRQNQLGDLLLNKEYQIDLEKTKTSGILIMFKVSFKLPDIFFTDGEPSVPVDSFADLLSSLSSPVPVFAYKIGVYNNVNKTITYNAMTELMSCPFFQLYVKLFEQKYTNGHPKYDTIEKDGISFDNGAYLQDMRPYGNITGNIVGIDCNDPATQSHRDSPTYFSRYTTRPMLYEVNTKILYSYFQYSNTFVNIDLSCSFFIFTDALASTNKAKYAHANTVQRGVKKGLAGGSKNKTQKIKNKYKKHTNKCNKKYTNKHNKKHNNRNAKYSKKCNK
jgi:hypothetical protein